MCNIHREKISISQNFLAFEHCVFCHIVLLLFFFFFFTVLTKYQYFIFFNITVML